MVNGPSLPAKRPRSVSDDDSGVPSPPSSSVSHPPLSAEEASLEGNDPTRVALLPPLPHVAAECSSLSLSSSSAVSGRASCPAAKTAFVFLARSSCS